MNVLVLDSPRRVARYAAGLVAAAAREGTCPAVALPTGRTPLLLYEELAAASREGRTDLSRVEWFALDEFLGPGVPPESTFRSFLLSHFIEPAGLGPRRLHSMDPECADPEAEAAAYEARIAACGGLELALLGIGANGHIAFNEPGTPRASRTGLRCLTGPTRDSSRHLFAEGVSVPETGLSVGIGTLLEARRIVLLATGSAKAAVVSRLLESEPDESLPASLLRVHLRCVLVADRDAAGE